MSVYRQVTGSVWMGDFRAVYPAQLTPPLVITDRAIFADPVSMGGYGLRYVPEVGGCMAPELQVPYNNRVTDPAVMPNVKDLDAHLLTDPYSNFPAPSLNWKKFTFSDPSNAYVFNYPDKTVWGQQVIDVKCASRASAPTFSMKASTDNLAPSNPTDPNLAANVQGFNLYFQRRLAPNSDGYPDHWNVDFQLTNWITYRIGISTQDGITLYVKNETGNTTVSDPDGGTHSITVSDEYGDILFGNGGSFQYPDTSSQPYIVLRRHLEAYSDSSAVQGVKSRAFGSELTQVKVLLVANKMLIWIGGTGKPYTINHYRNRESKGWLISYVTIDALNFSQCSFSLNPTRFQSSTKYRSFPQQFGFEPTNLRYMIALNDNTSALATSGTPITLPKPASWQGTNSIGTVKATTVSGSLATAPQYDFDMTLSGNGTSWLDKFHAPYSPVITKIQLRTEGTIASGSGQGLVVSNNLDETASIRPRMITETIEADFDGLTVNQSLSMTYTYFQGADTWRTLTGAQGIGNIAVGLQLGLYSREDESGTETGTANHWHFQGMCDTYEYNEDAKNTLVTMHCDSLMRILDERYIHAPAIYDGWNHYAAMHYLASYAGFTDAQMANWKFLQNPDDPTDTGAGGYTLPIEFGNRTWSPAYRSLSVRQAMYEIQKLTGFLLFVAADGLLHYEPFFPSSTPTIKRTFKKMPPDGYDDVIPTEMQNLNIYVSNKDVRNNVTVIGINASYEGSTGEESWQPIVAIARDEASISAPYGSQPYNYVGYRKDHVLIDARFANKQFAGDSAVRLYNIERQPALQVSFRTAFLQPDLFPLDYIAVETDKNIPFVSDPILGDTPLVVWKISHHVDTVHGGGYSDIVARYVAPYQDATTVSPIVY